MHEVESGSQTQLSLGSLPAYGGSENAAGWDHQLFSRAEGGRERKAVPGLLQKSDDRDLNQQIGNSLNDKFSPSSAFLMFS